LETDVFVHDMAAGETTRMSVVSSGEEADGNSDATALSRDGSTVAFASNATDPVDGDDNEMRGIFVRAPV
jgi:Tol biopolymer transport system component